MDGFGGPSIQSSSDGSSTCAERQVQPIATTLADYLWNKQLRTTLRSGFLLNIE